MLTALSIIKSGENLGTLRGPVSIQVTAGLVSSPHVSSGFILTDTYHRPYEQWYQDFVARKQAAMLLGGSYTNYDGSSIFLFNTGLNSTYIHVDGTPYLTNLQGAMPNSNGCITILGEKYLDVPVPCDNPNELRIAKSRDFCSPNSYYWTLYRMQARLYECYNNLARRLLVFDTDATPDGGFGPYLGSLSNYQAVVTRWNHNAWVSSMATTIVETPGSGSFSIGYTNLNCYRHAVHITAIIEHIDGLWNNRGERVSESEYSALSPNYTLYRMAVDSSILSTNKPDQSNINNPEITTNMFRNLPSFDLSDADKESYRCDGTGYLTSAEYAGGKLENIEISIAINPYPDGTPAFKAEQYYYEAFSIALPTGVADTFTPQAAGEVRLFHHYSMTTTWRIQTESGGAFSEFSRTELMRIPAANVIKADTDN